MTVAQGPSGSDDDEPATGTEDEQWNSLGAILAAPPGPERRAAFRAFVYEAYKSMGRTAEFRESVQIRLDPIDVSLGGRAAIRHGAIDVSWDGRTGWPDFMTTSPVPPWPWQRPPWPPAWPEPGSGESSVPTMSVPGSGESSVPAVEERGRP